MGRISSWVGDDQRIPAVACIDSFFWKFFFCVGAVSGPRWGRTWLYHNILLLLFLSPSSSLFFFFFFFFFLLGIILSSSAVSTYPYPHTSSPREVLASQPRTTAKLQCHDKNLNNHRYKINSE